MPREHIPSHPSARTGQQCIYLSEVMPAASLTIFSNRDILAIIEAITDSTKAVRICHSLRALL